MYLEHAERKAQMRNLKIVYFLDWQGRADAGVVTKVRNQVTSWQKLGHEVKVVLLTKTNSETYNFNVPTIVFKSDSKITRYFSRRNAFRYLLSVHKDWIVYRRYALMIPVEILSMKKLDTVIELNTNNRFFYKERGKLQFLWFQIQNSFIAKLAIGACAVTSEIEELNANDFKKVSTFTNAINLESFKSVSRNVSSQKLIFLAGDNFSWNGIHILQNLVNALPNYEIDVYGISTEIFKDNRIHFFDFITKEELDHRFSEYVAGITTLQLEKIGLNEAAPLKTREYLLRGLPVIGRFNDSGLANDFPFFFKLHLDLESKEVLNSRELLLFIEGCRNKIMNKSDLVSIDVEKVEASRITFIREIIA